MDKGRRYNTFPSIFFGVFVAMFGFSWGLIEAYEYFELTWFSGVTFKTLGAVILLLLSTSAGLAALILNVGFSAKSATASLSRDTFDRSLIETLGSAIKNKSYAEAIRIGIALNRPLFEAGNFATRLKIGRIVEEAAALTGREDIQVVSLIDSIGWSLVELGEYEKARRSISHGIDICVSTNNEFYEAKGYRHLGVIARRSQKYDEAEIYYRKSADHAAKISNKHDREVMEAGLNYAFSSLYYYTEVYDKASQYIDKSIGCFEILKDEYRYNMSLVMKGDIEYQKGKHDDAKDIYRKVLRRADINTEKLQVARSCLGLAEVYLADHQWSEARESIRYIEDIDLKDFKAELARLQRICNKLPEEPTAIE